MQYEGLGLPQIFSAPMPRVGQELDSPKTPVASHCNINGQCIRQLRQPKLQSSKSSFMAPGGPVTKDLRTAKTGTRLIVNSKRRGSLKIIVVDLTVSFNPGD